MSFSTHQELVFFKDTSSLDTCVTQNLHFTTGCVGSLFGMRSKQMLEYTHRTGYLWVALWTGLITLHVLACPALFFLFQTSKQRQAGSVQQWLWHRGKFSRTSYFICTQGVWHLNCSNVRKLDRVNSIPAAECILTFHTTVSLQHPWPICHGKVTLTHLHYCKNKTESGKPIE